MSATQDKLNRTCDYIRRFIDARSIFVVQDEDNPRRGRVFLEIRVDFDIAGDTPDDVLVEILKKLVKGV